MLKTLHAVAVALVALAAVPASAQTLVTWDGGGVGGNWLTGSNWIGDTAPVATNGLVFSGAIQTTNTNNFSANTIFDSITLTNQNWTLRGNALQLSSSGTDIFANVQGVNPVISIPIAASTGGLTVSATGGNTLTLGGVLSGTGGLTKDGNALVIISAAATYSGDTTLTNGIIRLGVVDALPATTVLRFSANANARRLQQQGFSQTLAGVDSTGATNTIIESASDTTNNAPATLTLNVASGTSFAFSGIVRNAAGGTNSALSITKSGGGTQVFSAAAGSVSYSGTTTINAGVLEFSGANSVANASPITLAGGTVRFSGGGTRSTAISGSGGLEKSGANLLTLSAASTYSGDTTWTNGDLAFGIANALPTTTVLQFSANANNRRLSQQGFSQTLAGVDSTAATGGVLILESALDNTSNAPATLTLNVASGTSYAFSGYVRNASGTAVVNSALSVTKSGSGTQVFAGSSDLVTYSGTTTINAGVLEFSGANSVANNSPITLAGGTVRFSGGGTRSTAIGGSGGLEKSGANLLTLSTNNPSFSGTTTLSSGTLLLSASNALGTSTVTVNGGLLDLSSGTVTLRNLNGGGGTISLGNGGRLTANMTALGQFGGVISGTGSLTKDGGLALTLAAASTYSGDTTLANGDLRLGVADALPAATVLRFSATSNSRRLSQQGFSQTLAGVDSTAATGGTLIVESAADGASNAPATLTLNVASGTSYAFSGYVRNSTGTSSPLSVTKNSGGTQVFSGTSAWVSYSGTTTINAGVLEFSGANSVANNSPITLAGGTVRFSGGGTRSTAISGSGGLEKSGANLLTLSTNNPSFSGTTTLSSGTLLLSASNALGTSTVTVNGGLLDLSSGTVTLRNLNGGGGTISLGNGGRLTATMDALGQFGGVISGTGGLTKDGGLALTLAAASTYSGDTTLANGNLRLGVVDALPTATVLRFSATSNNRRLSQQGFSQTLAGVDSTAATGGILIVESAADNTSNAPATLTLNVASGTSYAFSGIVRNAAGGINSDLSITKSGSGTQVFSGASGIVIYSGPTTINAGVLEFSGAGSVADTSAITLAGGTVRFSGGGTRSTAISGSGGLEKSGANLLTLSGSHSFSGLTTISAGTLAVNGALASGVNVANAAILGGSGTINGFVAVANGGILAPGNSPGTLSTTAGLSLVDSSILNFELNASDATVGGGINDLVEVTGDFTLAGILNVAGTGDFATVADYTTWRLFNYSGGTFTSGTLTLGTMPSVGSSGKYFQLDTATAGQVNLVIVPEPGALALAGLGIVAAAWALRRK